MMNRKTEICEYCMWWDADYGICRLPYYCDGKEAYDGIETSEEE